jgi:tetratricopeptide (TPR) repeat protein
MAHDHHLYMLLADSAAQQGDAAGLRQYAPRAEDLAARDGHRLYLAIAQRAFGVAHRLAGEYGEAEGRLTQALALFSDLGTGWQIGRTLFALAELDLARSDTAGAREHFSQALAAFEAIKAMPEVARTQAALEALGSRGEGVRG